MKSSRAKDPEFVGTWGLVAICVAFTITLNNFAVGASVMAGMTFWKGVAAIVVAWIFLSLTWIFSGQIGAMTQKPAAEIFKNVFGKQGFRIPSLMMSLACMGFGIFDFWFVGSAFANTFPGIKNVAFIIGIIVIVAIAIIGNLKNVTSIKWLTTATIPIALVLFIVIMVATVVKAGGMHEIMSFVPEGSMPFFAGVNTLFASFIAIASGFSDITCHSTTKAVRIAMPLCMLAIAFQFLVAQFGVYWSQDIVDFTSLAVALGGGLFYICNLFTVFAQANTVPSNTLVITTQLAANINLPRKAGMIIQPLLDGVLATALWFGAEIGIISAFANILGCAFGPLLGIIFAEFYIVRKRKFEDDVPLRNWSMGGILTLAIGFALGVYLTYFCPISFPVAILLLVLCFFLQLLFRKVFKLS